MEKRKRCVFWFSHNGRKLKIDAFPFQPKSSVPITIKIYSIVGTSNQTPQPSESAGSL